MTFFGGVTTLGVDFLQLFQMEFRGLSVQYMASYDSVTNGGEDALRRFPNFVVKALHGSTMLKISS